MPLLSYIDQPSSWDRPTRCVIIRGWCFAADGRAVTGVRLRTTDRTLHGVVGLPRPDVRSTLPAAPGDNTGFEIRGTLPPGRQRLLIEAQLAGSAWEAIMDRTVRIKRLLLPLWLGGGEWTELMFFQMPAHMAYPARAVRLETFPAPGRTEGRPKFSIVTPSYQQARYLGQTMRSVLEQQPGVQCDYVVQDGGSTDGSKEIIARYAEDHGVGRREKGNQKSGVSASIPPPSSLPPPPVAPRLIAWESTPDKGQADAIARAFSKTKGGADDVMAWINSDDYYQPGALGFVADYFARHPEVDVLYGHRIVVDEESREIARWFLPAHDDEVLRLNDFVPQETLFWRRRIWGRVDGLDTSLKFAIDWDLLLRFQAAGARIVRVPYFLACFRSHAAQKTAAVMHSTGQREITLLRERTQGRSFPSQELERDPRLLRYLRRSAFIEFIWQLGFRMP